jgi:cyclopropane-fatty-acyl-phospholipid synthase
MVKSGSLGLGEGYMHKWYTCDKMEEMITLLVRSTIFQVARPRYRLEAMFLNLQSITRSVSHVQHYNIGNDLYYAMLGETMQYTCGWWENIPHGGDNIDAAQNKKLEMICKKLNLKKGMRVVDIGCGWGYLMHYMVSHYDVKVIGVSISTSQIQYAGQKWPELEIKNQDYRDFMADKKNQGAFDRVVAVGFLEHVGDKNYAGFFQGCNRLLNDNGLAVIQCIGVFDSYDNSDEWIDKYIFPGTVIPSLAAIGSATENVLTMENWINIGPYYTPTLSAWRDRAIKFFAEQGPKPKYDEVFQRMWYFYLTFCMVMFRERETNLWQIVFSKKLRIQDQVLPVYGVVQEAK